MKVQSDKTDAFRAINLTIRIESAEEARALWAIFNHARNTALLPDHAQSIKNAIGSEYATYGEIAHGVTYDDFYE